MCIKVLYIFQQYVWWMFNTDNIHNTKKHQSPFVIKASLMSHHTKSLTRKTTCQQIKIRQFSDSFNRFCKMNNIPHYHLIFRIVIGTIGLNSLSIYLRISHMLKSCNLIPAKNIHSSTESANAGKKFYMLQCTTYNHFTNFIIPRPIASANLTGTAFPICAYHEFCAPQKTKSSGKV